MPTHKRKSDALTYPVNEEGIQAWAQAHGNDAKVVSEERNFYRVQVTKNGEEVREYSGSFDPRFDTAVDVREYAPIEFYLNLSHEEQSNFDRPALRTIQCQKRTKLS